MTIVTASHSITAGMMKLLASPVTPVAISCGLAPAAPGSRSRARLKATRPKACGTALISVVIAITIAETPIIVRGFVRSAWNAPS